MIPLGALLDDYASAIGADQRRIDLCDCPPDAFDLRDRATLAHVLVGPGLVPARGQVTRDGTALHWAASCPVTHRLIHWGPLPAPIPLRVGQALTLTLTLDLNLT